MAVTAYRSLGYAGFAKQSALGSGAAPTAFLKNISAGFTPKPTVKDWRNGNVLDVGFSSKEAFHYGGPMKSFLYASEGAKMLAWAMGADSVSGAGDPYTHAITLANSIPPISVEMSYFESQIIDRVLDCKIDKLLLEAIAGQHCELTTNWLGSSVAVQGSAATVTFTDATGNGPLQMSQGVITLTAGPSDFATLAGQIKKLSFEINRNISIEHGPGQLGPIYLLEQGRTINIKIQALFSGPAVYNLTHYGGSAGTALSAVLGTGSIVAKFTGQASPEKSIQLTVNNMFYEDAQPNYDPEGKTALIDITCVGFRSGATLPLVVSALNADSAVYV